jgi:hypothetical protein
MIVCISGIQDFLLGRRPLYVFIMLFILASTARFGLLLSHGLEKNGGSQFDGFFSVREFGARGDGIADDTEAFQGAIDAAAVNGGTVLVPPVGKGKGYVLTRTVRVPGGVTLMGSPAGFSANAWAAFTLPENHIVGAKIYARPAAEEHTKAKKKPLFYLDGGCTVRGFYILYDEQPWPTDQEFQDPESPYYYESFAAAKESFVKDHVKVYGPTFYLTHGVNNVVEDIICDRYYDFFFLAKGGKNFVSRIYLYGYRRAFVFGESLDINRMAHVHYCPNVGAATPGPVGGGKTYSWIYGIVVSQPDNIGIQMGRSDGYTFQDIFFHGIHTALRLGASKEYPLYDPVVDATAYYDHGTKTSPGFVFPYIAQGPWGHITNFGADQCNIGIHFVWPTHLTNRMSNAMIFTAYDDGEDFDSVAGTGDLNGVAKQGIFVVEPSHSAASNLGVIPTFMCSNSVFASFEVLDRFAGAAANARSANGRLFLFDGDLTIELSNCQINAPYDESLLCARGPNAGEARARVRGLVRTGQPSPGIIVDGTGMTLMKQIQ